MATSQWWTPWFRWPKQAKLLDTAAGAAAPAGGWVPQALAAARVQVRWIIKSPNASCWMRRIAWRTRSKFTWTSINMTAPRLSCPDWQTQSSSSNRQATNTFSTQPRPTRSISGSWSGSMSRPTASRSTRPMWRWPRRSRATCSARTLTTNDCRPSWKSICNIRASSPTSFPITTSAMWITRSDEFEIYILQFKRFREFFCCCFY